MIRSSSGRKFVLKKKGSKREKFYIMRKHFEIVVFFFLVVVISSTCCDLRVSEASSFGTNLGEFNGVIARSNGNVNYYSGVQNYVNGVYTGIEWQCVEYVRRYYLTVYSKNIYVSGGMNAYEFYDKASEMGLARFSNGSSSPPQVGDILVSKGPSGSNGHVAIVKSISGNEVCTIQQNFSNDSRDVNRCLSLNVSNGNYTVGGFSSGYPIQGWLRRPGTTAGYASVSSLSVYQSPVVLGQNFTINFTLKERNGVSKTFENVAVAILDSNKNYLFDFAMYDNVTVPANGTWSKSPSNYIYSNKLPGTYYAIVRGRTPGGNWFDFDTVSGASNPRSFTVIAPDTTKPVVNSFSVTPSTASLGSSFTMSYNVSDSGGSGLKQVELWRAPDNGGSPGTWSRITTKSLSGNGPVSGTFSDAPSSLGIYWYGMHVVDNAGNWSPEPSPVRVTVIAANAQPTGWLDSATCSNIAGWARDPDTTSPINVHVYANGPAGKGTLVAIASANIYRSDLPFTDKNHGYNIATPPGLKDNNPHSIYVYAIDSSGGTNPLLSGCPKTITCSPPPVVPTSLTINGASSVDENSSSAYTATVLWSDNTSSTVTPVWTLSSPYASISSNGLLTSASVTSDKSVTITAAYSAGGVTATANKTVTIVNVAQPRTPAGTWKLLRGCNYSQTFYWYINSDGSFSDNAGTSGSWGLSGNRIVLSYTDSHNTVYTGTIGPGYSYMVGTISNDLNNSSCWYAIRTNPPASSAFTDVTNSSYWAYNYIYALYASGMTSGCSASPLDYCSDRTVTRAEMSVFLERGKNGSSYVPPAATGVFEDVPVSPTKYWAADWIEQLYSDGMTGGCAVSPLQYCPERAITRAEMAVFLLRAEHGRDYTPPPAQGIFTDVPVNNWAADWIEQLYAEGITGGCWTSPLQYCPDRAVTRAEMAVFLVKTFLQ